MEDLVAVFQVSFHFTQGNTLDWSAVTSPDISLTGVEFSCLPSGLHTVDDDIVYFTKDSYLGVCVFRRRKTSDKGKRGFDMDAVGILALSKPWLHVPSLKTISNRESLNDYFEKHMLRSKDGLPSTSTTQEPIIGRETELSERKDDRTHPLFQLPGFLRSIGPSFITLYKCALARRRIMIYTQAPVEPACLLAQVIVEVAYSGEERKGLLERDDKRPPVLGMIGLLDIPKLERATADDLGWVACTSDALFREKPDLYDIFVDLSTMSPSLSLFEDHTPTPITLVRPSMYLSRICSSPSPSTSKRPSVKTQQIRFTFSDLRIWARLDDALKEYENTCGIAHSEGTQCPVHGNGKPKEKKWIDPAAWRSYGYEDVCIVCANIWMGSDQSGNGDIRLEGEDEVLDPSSKPIITTEDDPTPPLRLSKKLRTWSSSSKRSPSSSESSASSSSSTSSGARRRFAGYSAHPPIVQVVLVLSDIFQTHSSFLFDGLEEIFPVDGNSPSPKKNGSLSLAPYQMTQLSLSSLSELDSKFAEWLAMSRYNRRVAVKRGWKEMVLALVAW